MLVNRLAGGCVERRLSTESRQVAAAAATRRQLTSVDDRLEARIDCGAGDRAADERAVPS